MSNAGMNHSEAAKLLPWYVNGTLTSSELERLVSHVETCPDCRADLELAQDMLAAVNDPAAVPMVPKPDLEQLFRRLDGPEEKRLPTSRLPWAAAAAVVALAVAAMLYFGIRGTVMVPADYFTATSETSGTMVHYVLRIEFESILNPAYRKRLLEEMGAVEVTETERPDTLRVVVPLAAGSMQDLEAYTSRFRDRDGVENIEVVAVQLPMDGPQ